MEYLDFELEIGEGTGRDYPVEVLHSPAGERRATMRFPFDELELENHLLRVQNALLQTGTTRRRISSPADQAVQDFGQALFEALITNDIRSCFELSRHEAQQQGKGLRVKLRLRDPMLAALPWEFLYDVRQGEFMALSRYTPIVRYLDLPRAIQPLPVSPPLRILGMIASPDDLPPLNVERERQRVERAVASIQESGLVELTWLQGGTWQDLQRAMRKGPWHIFHFVGHGRFDVNQDEGVVALVGEQGETDDLTASQIGRLLADHPSLRLVMLNACEGARGGKKDIFSGTAATLVRRGIPAVVAMQYEITDRAAIEFARTFYEAVSDEMPLDAAVAEARKAVSVSISNTVEWGTPVLYMRSPDGVLFRVQDRQKARPNETAVIPTQSTPMTAPTAPSVPEALPVSPELAAFDATAFEAELRRRWEKEEAARREEDRREEQQIEADPASAAMAVSEAPRTPAADTEPITRDAEAAPIAHVPDAAPVAADAAETGVAVEVALPVEAPPLSPVATALNEAPVAIEPPSLSTGPLPPVVEPRPAPDPGSAPAAQAGAPSAADPSSMDFTVMGVDGELLVSRDWVGIRRRLPLRPDPRRPDRLEPIRSLAAVHLVPAGPVGQGFIQLCFNGEDPSLLKFWTAGKSPTTVMFGLAQQGRFASAKQWLDYYMALARSD
ncbi:MAG: CHAT domain-containing protein [Chloroflexota bacterium]|nr:CHAT domain-containing protein [Chloroflexota bacterium]